MQDSPFRVVKVAFLLCLVCSVSVSLSAVLLKERQDFNKEIDRQKNILSAVGLLPSNGSLDVKEIQRLYQKVFFVYVDVTTGDEVDPKVVELQSAGGVGEKVTVSAEQGFGEERVFSRYLLLYKILEEDRVGAYVIPIKGKGLWSLMSGYIALSSDLQFVKGITFYEQGETPGLGGEVENPLWKKQWNGKKIYDEQGVVRLSVDKGGNAKGDYGVDGLSGATITSRGVDSMVKFWLGNHAYGLYLHKQVSAVRETK